MSPFTELLAEAQGGTMTERKAIEIMVYNNMHVSGLVLSRADGSRCIVELGAVRWLINKQMQALMHPEAGE